MSRQSAGGSSSSWLTNGRAEGHHASDVVALIDEVAAFLANLRGVVVLERGEAELEVDDPLAPRAHLESAWCSSSGWALSWGRQLARYSPRVTFLARSVRFEMPLTHHHGFFGGVVTTPWAARQTPRRGDVRHRTDLRTALKAPPLILSLHHPALNPFPPLQEAWRVLIAWMTTTPGGFSGSGRAREIQDLFHLHDANGDGMLSIKELSTGLYAMGLRLSASEVQAFSVDLDTNGDGLVSLEGFTVGVSRALDEMNGGR